MNKAENNPLITFNKRLFSALFFLCLSSTLLFSQKKIEIVNADHLKFDKKLGNGAKRLIGNVQFKQDNTFMFCD
ncbi:MAG: hypothetical protein L6Q66_13440, partial [Bacteroidia bacterium]|nr:hypothetical protein [Bacteroidia bacterium]